MIVHNTQKRAVIFVQYSEIAFYGSYDIIVNVTGSYNIKKRGFKNEKVQRIKHTLQRIKKRV